MTSSSAQGSGVNKLTEIERDVGRALRETVEHAGGHSKKHREAEKVADSQKILSVWIISHEERFKSLV
jgi:hypothetical protein